MIRSISFYIVLCSLYFIQIQPFGQLTDTETLPKRAAPKQVPDSLPFTISSTTAKIEVLSFIKQQDTTVVNFEYKEVCSNWNLSEEDVVTIIQNSEPIDGHEFHYFYYVLPCYYSGQLKIDGKIAAFEINAGAHFVLLFKDTTLRYGYKKPDFKKYFIEGYDVDFDK